jgi:hypothetical protein
VQQDPDKTYFTEERTNDKDKNPIGFFPHQHDPLAGDGASTDGGFAVVNKAATGHDKASDLIHPSSKDVFKVRSTPNNRAYARKLNALLPSSILTYTEQQLL